MNEMVDGYGTKQDECANRRFYEFLTEERKIQELVKKDIEIDRLKAELSKVNGAETSNEECAIQNVSQQRELFALLSWMQKEPEFNIDDINEILDDYTFYKANCG